MAIRYDIPRIPKAGTGIKADWGDRLVRSLAALRPVQTPGMLMTRSTYGTSYRLAQQQRTPTVSILPLKPFAVRWFPYDSSDPRSGQWQIYLPLGCVSVDYKNGKLYTALPLNKAATDADKGELYAWYEIDGLSDDNAVVTTANTSRGRMVAKGWTVYARIKPWARMTATAKANDESDPVAWTVGVAEITETTYTSDGETTVLHQPSSLVGDPIVETWDTRGVFAIDYTLTNETQPKSDYKVEVVHQMQMTGRLQSNLATPLAIKGKTEVWVEVEHSSETFRMEVTTAPSTTESNDDVTVFKIYELDKDIVTADYRDDIPTLPFYTNAPDAGET